MAKEAKEAAKEEGQPKPKVVGGIASFFKPSGGGSTSHGGSGGASGGGASSAGGGVDSSDDEVIVTDIKEGSQVDVSGFPLQVWQCNQGAHKLARAVWP